MQVNVNAAVLALGIAIGAVGASWAQPLPARAAESAQEEARAVAWEYKRVRAGEKDITYELNDHGLKGWELVSVTEIPPSGLLLQGYAYLYLRRRR